MDLIEAEQLPDCNSAAVIKRRENSLHGRMVRSLRNVACVHVASAATFGLASIVLAVALAASSGSSGGGSSSSGGGGGGGSASTSLLVIVLVCTATLATLLQLGLALFQLRATNSARMAQWVAQQPPEYIDVDSTKPAVLQTLDLLTQLRTHLVTEGTPSSPRLLIRPVDADGRLLDETSHAGRKLTSRTRDIVREPLAYGKVKIRQAFKEVRGEKWEDTLSAEQTQTLGTGSQGGASKGSSHDVRGFLSANYGSALRYTEEAQAEAGQETGSRTNSPQQQRPSVTDAKLEAARAAGLALPIEPDLLAPAKAILASSTSCSADGWAFDAFELGRCTNDHALVFLGHHFLQATGLYDTLKLDADAAISYFQRLERTYRRNPYHNRDHACDVMQGAMWLLHSCNVVDGGGGSRSGSRHGGSSCANSTAFGRAGEGSGHALSSLISPADVLALLIAAAGHDADHTGQNNAYHVATSSDLAIVYNDKSVLENHHCASLFSVARHAGCDIFGGLALQQRREVRQMIITMVLSTDMAVHFKNVDRLRAALQSGDLDITKDEDKTFVLEMLMHAADIANPCRREGLYRKWTERVMAEFYEQGDMEKANGLPISKFFDRETPNVPRCQLGFIDFIVKPLMETMNELVDMQPLLDLLLSNRRAMELEAAEATVTEAAKP